MKMRDDSGQKHAWLAGGYLPAGKKIAAVITAVNDAGGTDSAGGADAQDAGPGHRAVSSELSYHRADGVDHAGGGGAVLAVAERRGAAGRQAADPAVPICHAGGFGDDHRGGAGRF